jgi:hypothetical protein
MDDRDMNVHTHALVHSIHTTRRALAEGKTPVQCPASPPKK